MTILMCAPKLTDATLIYRTVPKTKTSKMKKLKKQTDAGQETMESGRFLSHCYIVVMKQASACIDWHTTTCQRTADITKCDRQSDRHTTTAGNTALAA